MQQITNLLTEFEKAKIDIEKLLNTKSVDIYLTKEPQEIAKDLLTDVKCRIKEGNAIKRVISVNS